MAFKEFSSPLVGNFRVYKRKGSTSLRLSVNSNGEIRVSQPPWLPYAAGIKFLETKAGWIQQTRGIGKSKALEDGTTIGKRHYLRFSPSSTNDKIRTRLIGDEAVVFLPRLIDSQDSLAQKSARSVAERALRQEGKELLFKRLQELATSYDFTYKTVSLKKLKGRWGSCSNKAHITLNIFLLELPWQLIDYVLLHELIHTKHLNHSPAFWQEFERCQPDAKNLRKQVHAYSPKIGGRR